MSGRGPRKARIESDQEGHSLGRFLDAASIWRPIGASGKSLLTIAVDPGMETGVAWHLSGVGVGSFELPCWDAVDWVADVVDTQRCPVDVACEAYNIGKGTLKKSRQYWSLESIGALRWICKRRGVTFALQQPSDKDFGTDAKLKALGWYAPSRDGHQNDAARHLLKRVVDKGRLTHAMRAKLEEMLNG